MPTLLYSFNDPSLFPLLTAETTAKGPVFINLDTSDDGVFLRVKVRRQPTDAPAVQVVLGLPFVSMEGKPTALKLELLGDNSECHVFAEAGDDAGGGFVYAFATVDFTGWRTCRVDVQSPSQSWGGEVGSTEARVQPPLQIYRLGLTLPKSCPQASVGIRAMFVLGNVTLATPGIA